MELARREFLVGGAVAAGALAAMGPGAAWAAQTVMPVTVFDPAIPLARDYAQARAHSLRLVPLKGDRVRFWREHLASHRGAVSGFTTWADLVILRGLAAEQGLRLRSHGPLDERSGQVFGWVLA